MNVIIKWYAALTIGLLAMSCSRDNDGSVMQPMSLSAASVKICLREDAKKLSVSGGSGNFLVAVSGNAISAECYGRIITITPKDFGNAELTVTDSFTGTTARCAINVGKSFIELQPSFTIDPFFSKQNRLYMDCDIHASPRQWIITAMDGQKLHDGTFTTAYMRDETVTAEGEDYKFALFSLEMKEGNTSHHYVVGDMRTVVDGTPLWAILFPESSWSKPMTTALSRTAGPISFTGIMFFDSDADLLNPSVTWTVTGPVPLP
jgi:lipoprotein